MNQFEFTRIFSALSTDLARGPDDKYFVDGLGGFAATLTRGESVIRLVDFTGNHGLAFPYVEKCRTTLYTVITDGWTVAPLSESKMNFDKVREILHTNDGSLPDINFYFGQEPVAGDAYALIQRRATHLAMENPYYWSKSRSEESPIRFGENPAIAFLEGDAEGFHVVFGGLRSNGGAPIPDLGFFVLDLGFIALDYRMGPEWNAPAIIGLFEIMRDLKSLSDIVKISHDGNIFESDEGILLTEFKNWLYDHNSHTGAGQS